MTTYYIFFYNFIMQFDMQILQKLATKNLISVKLQENVLQNNFQIILKALKAHDSRLSASQKGFKDLQTKQINDRFQNEKNLQKMIASLSKIEKQMLSNNSKIISMEKNFQSLEKNTTKMINDSLVKIEEQIGKINGKVSAIESKVQENMSQISKITQNPESTLEVQQNSIKIQDLSNKFLLLESKLRDMNKQVSDINNKNEKMHSNIFDMSNNMNKSHSNIQQSKSTKLKNLVLNNDETKNSQKLKEMTIFFMSKIEELTEYNQNERKRNTKLFDHHSAKIESIQAMIKSHFKDTIGLIGPIGPIGPIGQPKDNNNMRLKTQNDYPVKIKEHDDNSAFKDEMTQKIKEMKENLIKAIKKMDKHSTRFDDQKLNLQKIENRLFRLQSSINDKIDIQTFSKWIKNIENKFKYIENIYIKVQANNSALITKHQLSCLSCDHKLKTFKANIGTHIITDRSRMKTIQGQYAGQSVLMRSKSRYEMPQLKR